MSKTSISAAALVALLSVGISSQVSATELDIATPGVNYPAWSTLGECTDVRYGQGCHQFHPNACGWEIYTTAAIGDALMSVYRDGHSVDIHTMKNGRFDEYICVLWS